MMRLAPLFLIGLIIASGISAGETSIQDALDKARRRAGGPTPADKAKQEKAEREKAWRQKVEEKYRKERDEAIRNFSTRC